MMWRIALTPQEILKNTNPDVLLKSKDFSPNLVFRNKQFLTYSVPSSSGKNYRVIVKILDYDTKDCQVSCTCKFWKYYGCEYHANKHNFLYGIPTGKGSIPKVRDPNRENWVCKHVASVLSSLNQKQIRKMASSVSNKYLSR